MIRNTTLPVASLLVRKARLFRRFVQTAFYFVFYRPLRKGEAVQLGDVSRDGLGWFTIKSGPYQTPFTPERTEYRRFRL